MGFEFWVLDFGYRWVEGLGFRVQVGCAFRVWGLGFRGA